MKLYPGVLPPVTVSQALHVSCIWINHELSLAMIALWCDLHPKLYLLYSVGISGYAQGPMPSLPQEIPGGGQLALGTFDIHKSEAWGMQHGSQWMDDRIDGVDIPFHSILDQDICFVSTSVQEFFFWMLVLLEFHPSRLPCTASCCFAFPVQSPCKHG